MEPRSRTLAPIVSVACWFDLYKYGSMMNAAGFDPYHPEARRPIERLRAFQRIVCDHSEGGFPTLVLNDGAVAYADIGLVRKDKLWKFIKRCGDLFDAAIATDKKNGGDGLRAVIAVGLRRRGRGDGIRAQEDEYGAIIDDLAAKVIGKDEAKERAKRVRRVFDIVPQLQANFAFTCAYLAETSGSSNGGFSPGKLYLDTRVFRQGIPSWAHVGEPVHWVPSKVWLATLATSFVPIGPMTPSDEKEARTALRTGNELLGLLRFQPK